MRKILLKIQLPVTPLAPLGETPRPFGFGSLPDARSSLRDATRTLPLALTTETAIALRVSLWEKMGAASPQWLPNAQFKFCQPKCDRPEARTIISLWKVLRFIASL
ncbi:hypothetical protein IQ229_01685 [Nostoc cf. edaphicum LEGE 07299]|uniref:Uncharacterized protein n=1 Tax=Nostoc cf. edaphicum LEGE 07299 TaxID=2777974 RepID=A0ABR9TUE7_9NOSO|nr:hypothetical protein [Nostoc edaphicum]MBE9103700.1 hypothetical protein [Nostoc cf. edaphicum LEGE 07299]